MILLRHMPATEVREAWGWIRNGLLEVIARAKARYTVEDVYVSIIGGQAFAYSIDADGDALGFAVLKKVTDFDGTHLFVWALWAEPGALRAKGAQFVGQLRELARQIGATKIRAESPRAGWVRFMEPVATIFELDAAD